jgi:hypothetical protein
MGIAKGAYSLLCELKKDIPQLGGSILQLGRQDTFITSEEMQEISKKFNINLQSLAKGSSRTDSKDRVDDVTLFQSLGFDRVESIDYSDFENPTHVHDFNLSVPVELHKQYDVIYDGGSLEHIFNFPQSLKNVFDLLKVGGVVIHASPSSNHVDHGFYMFSPTLFYDYYQSNGFEIVKSYIFEYEASHDKKPWLVYDYKPGCIDHLSFGGWGGSKLLGIWFVARKLEKSSSEVMPQQGSYLKAWSNHKNNLHLDHLSVDSTKSAVFKRIKSFVKSNRFLYTSLLPVVSFFRRSKPCKPPVISTY